MTGDLWGDDQGDPWPQEPRFYIPDKYLIPIGLAIIIGGGWVLGWFEPIMRYIHAL